MSWFDAIYGRPGRGVGPDEPEKKGLARFAQMLGRDFGQMIATNFVVCVLILPAALGVSLGVILLNFPFTLLAGLLTGLPAGVGLLLMADCALRSLSNDPSPWMYRAIPAISLRRTATSGDGAPMWQPAKTGSSTIVSTRTTCSGGSRAIHASDRKYRRPHKGITTKSSFCPLRT